MRRLRAAATRWAVPPGGWTAVVPAGHVRGARELADELRSTVAASPSDGAVGAEPSTVVLVDPAHGDLPPVTVSPGGAAVVVASAGRTRVRDVDDVLDRLDREACPVAAVVLLDRRAR